MSKSGIEPTSYKDEIILAAIALGLVVAAVAGGYASLHLAAWWEGRAGVPANPVALAQALWTGEVSWTSTATTAAIVLAVALLVAIVALVLLLGGGSRRERVDHAVRHMASRREISRWGAKSQQKKASDLGARTETPGAPVGKALMPPKGRSRSRIYAAWNQMMILLAGPQTQKTSCYAIPNVLAAPSGVLVTSNKRDIVDATRGVRSELGDVWVFDPQRVANEKATWWWNPLTYIAPVDPATGRPAVDPRTRRVAASETKAKKLAGQLATSSRDSNARTEPYWDNEAENLIAQLLLAAACANESLATVYRWLTNHTDEAPLEALREQNFTLQEDTLYSLMSLPDKQREGIYGPARSIMAFVTNPELRQWIAPPNTRDTPRFDPHSFARSTDTLYLLSVEGEGSGGPIVAALTVAVADALEEYATESPSGRLPVPFVGVLDEAANVCRWRQLPKLYSHYGSRGIILLTILQNWTQGEGVWGRDGMETLWSAANVKVYGGGIDDDRFLGRLSSLVGPYEYISRTESISRGSRQRSRSVSEKTILTISELRELPSDRAMMFGSGTPAMLIAPQPWYQEKGAETVKASIDDHAPTSPVPANVEQVRRVADEPEPLGSQPDSATSTRSPWSVRRFNE